MSKKEHKFWAYNSFKKQLTVDGYIKEEFESIPYHPSDIISLIFQYYHTFILELQYFSYDNLQSTNKKKIISAEPNKDIWVRPNTASQWAIRSTSPINNLPLQYEFSIKCIENMSNNNVFIGIAPFNQLHQPAYNSQDNRCRYYRDVNGNFKCDIISPYEAYHDNETRQSAYFIQNTFNSYKFIKHTNWWKRRKHTNFALTMECQKRISAPLNFRKNDIISLILNCKQWKLSFYINNIFINSMDIGKDVIYSPVILFKNCQNAAKCKIISMKCSLIKGNSNQKRFDKCDVNEYIFICGKKINNEGGYTHALYTTEPGHMYSSYSRGIERQMQSKNNIFAALYKGKKILFHESKNLNNLIVAMKSGRYNFHLWLIFEIYMFFCEEYKALLFSLISNEKISGIITEFVFENFEEGYEEYIKNDGMLRNLMCYKWDKWVKSDVYGLKCSQTFEEFINKTVLHSSRMDIVELNENDLPKPGIYSGINMHFNDYCDGSLYFDYRYYDYYDDGDVHYELDRLEEYKARINFYNSYCVKAKFNNSHRKKKRKEKQRLKNMKKASKKQKRIELNTYVKKYSLVY